MTDRNWPVDTPIFFPIQWYDKELVYYMSKGIMLDSLHAFHTQFLFRPIH